MQFLQTTSARNRWISLFFWTITSAIFCSFLLNIENIGSVSYLQKLLIEIVIWGMMYLFVIGITAVVEPKPHVFRSWLVIFAACLLGTILGMPLSFHLITDISFDLYSQLENSQLKNPFFWNFLSGSSVFGAFFFRESVIHAQDKLQEEQTKRLAQEKEIAETNLRFLQAQIEPHFLFNTLSNVLSLLETEPQKGRQMLLDLTKYLRESLSKTRMKTVTLGQEEDILNRYLALSKIRMGERLEFKISIPPELKNIKIPPMLLQPLVENAIKHGLEPKIEGGMVTISGYLKGENIYLEVTDTGIGTQAENIPGVGIDNVRKRIRIFFGEQGKIVLRSNKPSGLTVSLEFPYES
jgi:sensor histidine kinase YesM